MEEISRRKFAEQVAKSCLGVGAILGAQAGLFGAIAPAKIPTARSVIFLYMAGGMTHVDTFDPKPENKDVMGETKAINTSADGIQLGHWLPETAKQMHKASLVRSLNTNQGAHQQATYLLHTSYQKRGTIIHPTLGSWITKKRGQLNPTLPANVQINGGSDILGAGYLEKKYGPLPIGNPNAGIQNVKKAGYVGQELFNERLDIAKSFNSDFLKDFPQKGVRAYTDLYDDAIKLMKSKDLDAFDLTKENQETRDAYGDDNFGQGCLLARRLVETGVRFVKVQYGGWDMHNDVFGNLENRAAVLDKALSTLLYDLDLRGLLSETMVVVCSEFGRSPEVKAGRIGRDHHPSAFSALLAGGGIKGGYVHGQSDERAHYVEEGGVGMVDLNATIAHAMGLNINKTEYSPSGRPFKVAHDGQIIKEILS
jgi:hypothetical protein|tara:strand:+ start:33 stop:1304 length:1272 start_codon:yes stop_codon:yes gene_type:complete